MRRLRGLTGIAVASSLSVLSLACGGNAIFGRGSGAAGGGEGASRPPSAQGFDRLKDADDRVNDTGERLRDGIPSCVRKPTAVARSCLRSLYAPYGRALRDIRQAVDRARAGAGGRCRVLLDKVDDTAIDELALASRSTRTALRDGRHADVDSRGFAVALNRYRHQMEDVLSACEP